MSVDLTKPIALKNKWATSIIWKSFEGISESDSLKELFDKHFENVDIPSLPDLNKTHKLGVRLDFKVYEITKEGEQEYAFGRMGKTIAATWHRKSKYSDEWLIEYPADFKNHDNDYNLIPIEPKKKKWTTAVYETMTGERFTDTFIGEFNEPYGAKIIKSFEWEEEIE